MASNIKVAPGGPSFAYLLSERYDSLCHGWSSVIAIHKEILVFTFSFNLNLSYKDIKVENM